MKHALGNLPKCAWDRLPLNFRNGFRVRLGCKLMPDLSVMASVSTLTPELRNGEPYRRPIAYLLKAK
jgi:hypothetical protein